MKLLIDFYRRLCMTSAIERMLKNKIINCLKKAPKLEKKVFRIVLIVLNWLFWLLVGNFPLLDYLYQH